MQPGNLIRTPDGRLAILDFGLMTQIDDNIKFGMIEVGCQALLLCLFSGLRQVYLDTEP